MVYPTDPALANLIWGSPERRFMDGGGPAADYRDTGEYTGGGPTTAVTEGTAYSGNVVVEETT